MFPRIILLKRGIRFQSTLVSENLPKASKILQPLSTDRLSANEAHPLPVNVEAVYHAPLRNPIKHGDLVADLQLRAYDNENLDFYSDFILRVGYYLGMSLTGPKPLPTRRERWTVIKSPFAQAKSKENFERHTHKRLIRVWDTTPEVVDLWLAYINKHSITGVGMKCNIFQRAGLNLTLNKKNSLNKLTELEVQSADRLQNIDEVVGEKVLELLNTPEFKKHI